MNKLFVNFLICLAGLYALPARAVPLISLDDYLGVYDAQSEVDKGMVVILQKTESGAYAIQLLGVAWAKCAGKLSPELTDNQILELGFNKPVDHANFTHWFLVDGKCSSSQTDSGQMVQADFSIFEIVTIPHPAYHPYVTLEQYLKPKLVEEDPISIFEQMFFADRLSDH